MEKEKRDKAKMLLWLGCELARCSCCNIYIYTYRNAGFQKVCGY